MRRNDLLDIMIIVALILIMVAAMIFSFSREMRMREIQPEPERNNPIQSETVPEQSGPIQREETAVDTFIEDVPVRSSTGPSEPHNGIPEGIDPEDRDLVERIVMAEAGAEPYPGIVAVAQVILDQCSEWGISIRETCTVPGRFTEPYAGDVSDRVRTAVHEVFDLGVRVTDEPITHFHNPTVDPYWAHTLTFVTRIGDHLFYR